MTPADDEVEALAREMYDAACAAGYEGLPWGHAADLYCTLARFVLAREAEIKAFRLPAEPPAPGVRDVEQVMGVVPAPDAFRQRVAETAREILIAVVVKAQGAIVPADVDLAVKRAEAIETRIAAYLKGGAA